MDRFILRYRGQGAIPESVATQVRSLPGVTVIDDGSPRMMLVDAPPAAIERLRESALSDWTITPERMIPLPDPRPKIKSN